MWTLLTGSGSQGSLKATGIRMKTRQYISLASTLIQHSWILEPLPTLPMS